MRRNRDVATRRVLDETIVVPVRGQTAARQEIYVFNEVAAFVWERLDGRRRVKELVEDVVAHFDVDVETARVDVETLLTDLRELGLVEDAAE